ncbi:hypothetical protein EGI31_14495 [Lacihabitans soyangensis]|uniref:Uncharacterized protein n=1 Tax=Lacihabitans soyangensis TaxID=869394 RepID=A0AAE3H557_9BACT|nr:hypothetical protein [Lacihabitans soyangensis]
MQKLKYYLVISIVLLVELLLIIKIYTIILKYGFLFLEAGSISSGSESSKFILLIYILPFLLCLRIIYIKLLEISTVIFLIQNTYLFFSINIFNHNTLFLTKLYFVGMVLNLIFYKIDNMVMNFLKVKFQTNS